VTTLDAPAIIADVETYLGQQYERRQVPVVEKQTPYDGVIVILAWLLITYILIGGK
jgi:hypothetical protein